MKHLEILIFKSGSYSRKICRRLFPLKETTFASILIVGKVVCGKLGDIHNIKIFIFHFSIKFQKILNIPAAQLVNRGDICKLVSNNNLKIMIISADHWLSLLP